MLNNVKLSTRIIFLGVAIIVSFVLVFSWVIPKVRNNLYDSKYTKTKNVVETAAGVLQYYVKLAKDNAMPLEEAKKRGKEAIKLLRYDGDDYFWINDTEPKMVMHPIKPEMDGKNVSDEKDPTGKRFFIAMVDVC